MRMFDPIYLGMFIFGAAFGSFLNVVIYRFQKNVSIITPRSYCPKCKSKLTWKENIPLISYLIQRRKCLHCNKSISFRYPLVEFLTGIFFIIFINSSPSFLLSNSNLFLNLFFKFSCFLWTVCSSTFGVRMCTHSS